MTLIKRTMLGFLLAGSLGTIAGCTDKEEPAPMAEPEDDDDDDSEDYEEPEDDSTGELMDAGRKGDGGKADGGKDGGRDAGKDGGPTVRGMDAGSAGEDASTTPTRPTPGEVTTGPGTSTVTTVEGATIYLDKECPPVISVARNNPRFQGCCLPGGQCGATGYGAQDLNNVAFQCRAYDDPALANWIIPTSVPDEIASCTVPAQP